MKTETLHIESLPLRREEDRRCIVHRFEAVRAGRILEWVDCRRCGEPGVRERRPGSPSDWSAVDREIAIAWYREMASRTLPRARLAG